MIIFSLKKIHVIPKYVLISFRFKRFKVRSFFKVALLLVLSITTAISSHDEEFSTPVRTTTVAARTIEPTPGQRICQRQATILTRENFVSVLDADVVDVWGIDWPIFQNQSLPFDAPQKRVALKIISEKLGKEDLSADNKIILYGHVAQFKNQMDAVHSQRLDEIALSYFGRIFPGATLTSEMKLGGVQLGKRIIVSQPEQPDLTFHVKTHSAGRLSSKSTAAKLVNPQELMAYKVLQHLGSGCDSHFFQRSPEDVYIATLDAGTGGFFTLFDVVSGHLGRGGDDTIGRHLAGNLIGICQDPRLLDLGAIEATIADDPVAQSFISQMVNLDIVTRICRLHDLLNNPGNFGFFESSSQSPSIRVIDFRVIDDPVLRQEIYDPFGGFLAGNGLYNYAGSHRTMRYVLHDRPLKARVETAKNIMSSGLADRIKVATQGAHREVIEYLSQDVFSPCMAELMPELEEYVKALMYNADFFFSKLQEWKPEEDTA
jgi:hypothetical protein